MSTVHEFKQSRARSEGYDDLVANCMQLYFGAAFGRYSKNTDLALDMKGVDATVELTNGKQVYLDLKADSYNTEQVALELWSNTERGKLGWTCDNTKLTDLVVYIKVAKQRLYVFPFLQLQRFMRQQCQSDPNALMDRMKVVRNPNYTTTIALYSTDEMLTAMGDCVVMTF